VIAAFQADEPGARYCRRNLSPMVEWNHVVIPAVRDQRWRLDVCQEIEDVDFIAGFPDPDGVFG
jgi:hypothetical protein